MEKLKETQAILRSMAPPGGSYSAALRQTDTILRGFVADPLGLQSLVEEMKWYDKARDQKKTVKVSSLHSFLLVILILSM